MLLSLLIFTRPKISFDLLYILQAKDLCYLCNSLSNCSIMVKPSTSSKALSSSNVQSDDYKIESCNYVADFDQSHYGLKVHIIIEIIKRINLFIPFTHTTNSCPLRFLYKAFSTVIVLIYEDFIIYSMVDETLVTLDRETFQSCIDFLL